jgi:cytochrome c
MVEREAFLPHEKVSPEVFWSNISMHIVQAFVYHNMPQNHPGTLSAQEAYDVSAFIRCLDQRSTKHTRAIDPPSAITGTGNEQE